MRVHQYSVEVHKKWAISAACIVFVIVGVPMALRFPRGGMALVLGGGSAVFALNYVGLIAGESLGDAGILSPAAAMWGPNTFLLIVGCLGLWRVSREAGSTRGDNVSRVIDLLTLRFRRRAT
jgi:lipopolysaccharide export system permease protein